MAFSSLKPIYLYLYYISALYVSVNLVFYACTKHIELDYHFVCKKVVKGDIIPRFLHIHQIENVSFYETFV